MTPESTGHNGLLLRGLDGANPLAFLAALGTLRTLSLAWPDKKVRMNWVLAEGAWRPVLLCEPNTLPEEQVLTDLASYIWYRSLTPSREVVRAKSQAARGAQTLDWVDKKLNKHVRLKKISTEYKKKQKKHIEALVLKRRHYWLSRTHPYVLVGKDTNAPHDVFRRCLKDAMTRPRSDRFVHDQFAALGTDLPDEEGRMLDTALRTMSGSGHQHQLEFMANLLEQVTPEALQKSLFQRWDYSDPVKNLTLRLDPNDDARYALRWSNPSTDPTRNQTGSMLGANALAVMGFSLVSTVPTSTGINTTGFSGTGSHNTFWTWPLWQLPASVDVVRSILANPILREKRNDQEHLRRLGIAAVYRARRLTVGKFRCFTPAEAL